MLPTSGRIARRLSVLVVGLLVDGLLAVGLLAIGGCDAAPPKSGAVVLAVEPSGTAARSGIEPGDIIVGWRPSARSEAVRAVEDPLELASVEIQEAGLGPVTLVVRRGRGDREVNLEVDEWQITAAPVAGRDESAARRGALRLDERDETAAPAAWKDLAAGSEAAGRGHDAAWYWARAGGARLRQGDASGARQAFARARGLAGRPDLVADLWEVEGTTFHDAGDGLEARRAHEQALAIRQGIAPESTAVAMSLMRIASADYRRQEPQGVEPAEKGVEMLRHHPAARLQTAWAIRVLANFAYVLGHIDRAETLYREALALREEWAPEGPEMTILNQNLGLIAHDRGFLDEAEHRYRQSLAASVRLDPEGDGVAYVSNYLGVLAMDKGSYEEARTDYERALAIFRHLRPAGLEVAGCLNNLGNVALRRGDLVAAERFHREALERRMAVSPNSIDTAASLHNLGRLVAQLGRPEEGEELLQRALLLKQRLSPGTLLEASTLFELGEIARAAGAFDRAEELHTRALELRHAATPGSSIEAASLFALGSVAHDRGRLSRAEELWRRAIAMLESQREQLRFSSDDKSRFVAPFHGYYKQLAVLLFETDRAEEALDLLESARARALRVMMKQRGTPRVRELAPELAAERYRVEADLEHYESRLERVNPVVEPARAAEVLQSIHQLEERLDGVDERIRAVAPQLAALNDPKPLGVAELSAALDPGSLLLVFSVDDEETLLFTLAGGGEPQLRAYSLPVGAAELARRVSVLRALIERGRDGGDPEPALIFQAAQLFDLLLAPADQELEAADRLLLVADGPLLTLPFGVLVRSRDPLQYVATWRPLAVAQSATVFAELRREHRPRSDRAAVVAFGDPDRGRPGGDDLGPLPYSRREVERIAELFGDRASVFHGGKASERRAKATVSDGGFVHFATHAVLDRRFPLDSALVLSPPRRGEGDTDDGLLHAWEIAEEMQLDADLVVLSACDSALGGELAGEGMLGLARAFQYAGARSLVVSQWPVSDRATTELMVRFYRRLQAGEAKSEALRDAQAELLAMPAAGGAGVAGSHPFDWAAFQVIGDWE
jgi:CHAT domain-containing protein/Tfp pilus assembly protein PilF